MEGMLHKWTNYISGWQPRWFVLDGGTLSYYDSQEDAWKGCKGSIKISVCEIQVHSSDSTRVDLTIPGEQYFYLRAINAAERQKWLVALGTAKACLTDNRTKREKELQENTETLKTKMSELRLYCDLLLQQVNKIKENDELDTLMYAYKQQILSPTGIDTGNMVKSTCTTFLKTLEECMQIANRTFSADLATQIENLRNPVCRIILLLLFLFFVSISSCASDYGEAGITDQVWGQLYPGLMGVVSIFLAQSQMRRVSDLETSGLHLCCLQTIHHHLARSNLNNTFTYLAVCVRFHSSLKHREETRSYPEDCASLIL
ncbi:Pleckstrin -like proteiny domain-containing family A member 8 [Collichthys lucidus]|uniref:Pleckstrin-like proteiny domain-containing family A member 8 n=1 Tax=Collichthys lucidus TaxID=240159 RepID=A0A4V6AQV1_COLLU|nr:Pleckstrin -like proteiny domain-containing family A member 8 [Collichthys lucidus]